jgi:hypothetical protein
MNKIDARHQAERGGAGVKLVLILLVLFLLGNAGLNFIPVAYEGENFKQEMQTAVVQGLASPINAGKPTDLVKAKLQRAAASNNLPPDAFMEVKQPQNGNIQARVVYAKPISILPFGIYTYNYEFDHTATPVGFLTKN